MSKTDHPQIIQGGMGVGVSSWVLAQSVSRRGQMGVVSGTALDVTLARRLQRGDPGGHLARAMAKFPYPAMAKRVWDTYYVAGGKSENKPFKSIPVYSLTPPRALLELTVLGNFVEVTLAKSGHFGVVGINFLEKIQLPTLPSIFGAMLAGVNYVLMGAGIPRSIPGVLDRFAEGKDAKLKIDVVGASAAEEYFTHFDPADFCGGEAPQLPRPKFLPIVSSATLAITMAKRSTGAVDGFVVEGPLAGGHNAPPRGVMQLTNEGEPIYGDRDVPELDKIKALGLPFWLAGDYAHPHKFAEALKSGAAGVQVGTAFAFCQESGIQPDIKAEVLAGVKAGKLRVFTDPVASPTGFPFKVVHHLDETVANAEVYQARERICDLGYLRHLYKDENGKVGYRCPAEPVEHYLRKGGSEPETEGRMCLCNGLLATMGIGQAFAAGGGEPPVVTAGDDLVHLARFFKDDSCVYHARDVIEWILSESEGEVEDLSNPLEIVVLPEVQVPVI